MLLQCGFQRSCRPPREALQQFVFGAGVDPRAARITLTRAAADQLAVDATGFLPLADNDVQATLFAYRLTEGDVSEVSPFLNSRAIAGGYA